MDSHQLLLSKHCRVCGKRLCKKSQGRSTSYSCVEHNEALLTCFGIDIGEDSESVHPTMFCSRCYAITKRAESSKGNKVYRHAVSPMEWTPHYDIDTGCLVRTIKHKI